MEPEGASGTAGQGGQDDDTPQEESPPIEGTVEGTGEEQPHPFWSERATEEFRLRQARPLGLAEYDDRSLEPDYAASDTVRSGGYRSVEAASVRAQSPLPLGSEQRPAGTSQGRVSSSVPSVSSRSRSPAREDFISMRELVSFGGAIASLAEEQRYTQQRLARVEEARSGSNSSMLTGREDNDSAAARVGDLGVGPQYYRIGDKDRDEPRDLGSGLLGLEDWVQAPMRLEDIPQEMTLVGPVGVPESFHPAGREVPAQASYIGSAHPEVSAQVQGIGLAHPEVSAQVQGIGLAHPEVSAQVQGIGSAHREVSMQGVCSARHEVSAQVQGIGSAHREVSMQGIGLTRPEVSAQVQGIGSAHREVSAQVQGISSAHREVSAQVQGIGSAPQTNPFGSLVHREGSAYVGVSAPGGQAGTSQASGVGTFTAGATLFGGHVREGLSRGMETGFGLQPQHVARNQGLGMQSQLHEVRLDPKEQTPGGMSIGQEVVVWVDGLPRLARVGPRGLEVVGSGVNPFTESGGNPFVPAAPASPLPPPPPPRYSPNPPLRFSPVTPNGTRIPKGPPPSDCMEWPDWTRPMGEVGSMLGATVSPPPLPPNMREATGPKEGSAYDKPEEPSRSVTELPELQAFTPQEGSVQAGDWITQLSPVIGTMSATSSVWWTDVLREAYHLYNNWLAADPVQRLSIKAEASCSLSPSPRHVLIEQRLTVLLMRAVPAEIRAELVAVRAMSSLAVIVAVLCRYQPGGPNERANVLAFLVAPERPASIEAGVATCRRWLRQLQRAKELGLMLPDATLLIKGADSLLGPVLTKSQQASFRLNSFRNEKKLDYAPAFDAIVAFGQLILAEYELLQHSEPGEPKKPKLSKAQEGEDPGNPKGGKGKTSKGGSSSEHSGTKGGKGAPNQGTTPYAGKESGKNPCKYWCVTDMGCTKAARCPDFHSKELLKGTNRCWVCSSTQHRKQDCPRLSKESPTEPAAKPKAEPKVKVTKDEAAQPALAPSAQQILNDTAALLKNLRISKVGDGQDGARALLDSGATACMRTALPLEVQGLPQRTVQLAQGQVHLRVNAGGTLLTVEEVDPIVSLHKLCQIGYRVSWSRDGGCRVKAPGRPALRVYVDGGCPEVDRHTGLGLIREIEEFHERKARAVRSLRVSEEGVSQEVSLKEALKALPVDPTLAMKWLSQRFPSLPVEVLARVPVAASYEADRVAWNRRQRRSWQRSQALALRLFSGPDKKFWDLPRSNAHCISVDIQENILDDQTYAFLQSLALTGKVAAVFGGPPCRTFSLARYMPPDLPRPLRGRSPDTQWGFDDLTPSEREAVQTDGVLLFRMIWLYVIAEAVAEELHLPKPFMGLEQPKDPQLWVRPQEMGFEPPPEGFASCWALDAIKDLIKEKGFFLWHFDQGPLGHEKRKPTTIMANIPPPPDVLVTGPGHGVATAPSSDVRSASGPWPSASWSAWAPGLKVIMKREVLTAVDSWTSVKCRTLRDQENFLRHVVQGHMDFRRDCAACLAGAARGARHDRKSVHDAWVLHVDLMGPFAEGADEHGKVRYVLTGVLTLPDFTKVSQAVQQSEDIASNPVDAIERHHADEASSKRELASPGASVYGQIPLSTLGPPVSWSSDDEYEGYEPSEPGEGEDVMALKEDPEEPPTLEVDDRAAERANQRWIAAATALQLRECPVLEVPLIRTLPDKSQQTVAQGLAAMMANLNYEGFMVRKLHSDRGREFNNGVVQRLCRQRDVYQTFTQGDDPKQNGRVESYHARLKGRTRTLLKAVSGGWGLAVCHADCPSSHVLQGFASVRADPMCSIAVWDQGQGSHPCLGKGAVVRSRTGCHCVSSIH